VVPSDHTFINAELGVVDDRFMHYYRDLALSLCPVCYFVVYY
jgi:hypothetical protein